MSDVKALDINGTSYDIKAITVADTNSGSLKYWTGTRQQYDAIQEKDSNTIYNVVGDADTSSTVLDLLYPVGAVYIGTMATCPLAALGIGTWQLVSSGRVLQGVGSGQNVGDTVEAGLPNITGSSDVRIAYSSNPQPTKRGSADIGAVYTDGYIVPSRNNSSGVTGDSLNIGGIDASKSNAIYGNSSTVQPPAYLVNIWERIE